MPSIEITFKTDRSIDYQEQEFHEQFISEFKHQLEKRLDYSHIRMNNLICMNLIYNADTKKFKFTHISIHEDRIIEELKEDTKFYKFYF